MVKASSSGWSSDLSGGAETIVARATAPGPAALAVVRLSGPEVRRIASEISPAVDFGEPWRARLVVLSACETALGPLGQGEGLVGLVSAFQQAGAQSVLATQWTIGETAAGLMASYYKSMKAGSPLAEALREAKREALKKRIRLGDSEVSLAHPFFWAPFVLIGGAD